MDTIVVGVLDPMAGNVHQQDGVGAAVADIAAGGQLRLLFGRQALAAVRADQQPRGALAGGGPLGVVGQRGDAVQRRVHPRACRDHRDNEHQQERQHDAAPMSFAARLFRLRWRRRLVRHRCAARGAACLSAAGPRGGAVAAGGAGESAGSAATAGQPVAVGSSGHAGSLATAPGAPSGRDPGTAAGCRSPKESTTASRGGPRPTHSRHTRPSRSPRAR